MTLEDFQHMLDEIRGLELGSLQIESLEDGRETDLGETLPGPPDQDPLSLCLQGERKQMLASAIAHLPEREQQVLALYYQEELTMKEVGAVLGVGESRVSQIHSLAVSRLRAALATNGRGGSAGAAKRSQAGANGTMEKVLSQGEIDALFRAARGEESHDGGSALAELVEPWDLHQAGLLGKEQLHSISQLHESFARNLTSAVGGYLQDKFEVALVAVEQLAYRDFLARFSDVTYYSSFRLPPNDANGILHIDLSLAFPIVDLLLGGRARCRRRRARSPRSRPKCSKASAMSSAMSCSWCGSLWDCMSSSGAVRERRRCFVSCHRRKRP